MLLIKFEVKFAKTQTSKKDIFVYSILIINKSHIIY
jgi:hypothetical protein